MADETELKLELDSIGADALENSGLHRRECVLAKMTGSYFDTPDFALRNDGVSLRIREAEGKRVQTVKASGASGVGLFTRSEWELPVTGATPEPDPRTPVATLLGPRAAELFEVFTVETQRKAWRLLTSKSEIEVAIDRGELCASHRREPFCEVELELIRGEPAALFALARRIDGIAPVRIGVLTKPERGYRLLSALASSEKAASIAFGNDANVASAFAAVAEGCIRHYRLNEAILLTRRSPEAVHQARVALRRLRSSFSVFRKLLPQAEARNHQHRLRQLAALFANPRDLDVLTARVGPGLLAERLAPAREVAWEQLDAALSGVEPRRLMLDLTEWLECGNWRDDPATLDIREMPLRQFAAARLDRLRRKVRKEGQHLETIPDEQRHEVRKDAKKLRYATDFFAALFDTSEQKRRRKKFTAALQALQDNLGALNDRVVAEARLAALGITEGPEFDDFFASWDDLHLLESAAGAHCDLADAKPFWR